MNFIQRWFQHKQLDSSLAEEIAQHLEEKTEALRQQGMNEQDARTEARKQFGNPTLHQENSREVWGWNGVEQILKDLQFGFRLLAKSPVFTITALLTLALGIGATTAMFTIVDAVILQPLSYRNSGELVVAWERVRLQSTDFVLGPNPRHVDIWRRAANMFQGMTLLTQTGEGVSLGTGHPRMIGTVTAETNIFDVLQTSPLLGRGFRPDEGFEGRNDVAILTFTLWQSLFNGDPEVLGKTIRVNQKPFSVIGVLPQNFRFPNGNSLPSMQSQQRSSNVLEPELFVPAAINLNEISWGGDYGNWTAIARLQPGVSIEQANAQLASAETQVLAQMPVNERDSRPGSLAAYVQPMREALVNRSRMGLLLLMGAVMSLMLIACLNLANAQLARSVLRSREAALRSALGASKWRLFTNALAENIILAITGGLLGLAFAATALHLLRLYSPVDLPRLSEVHLNLGVLLFSTTLALAACLLFGLLPALTIMRTEPQAALQQHTTRAFGSRRGRRLRVTLIGLQVFGCTALLLLTCLFTKSLAHLLQEDKGFSTDHIAVAAVDLSVGLFPDKERRRAFDDVVLHELQSLPGVKSAALISTMPLTGESWIEFLKKADAPDEKTPPVNLRWISPGYFDTVNQKIIAGRAIEERDRTLSGIVLSASEAQALAQHGDILGTKVQVEGHTFTVVGVAADALATSLKSAPPKMAYVHYQYRPPYHAIFLTRSEQRPDLMFAAIRNAIWKQEPMANIASVKSLDSQMTDSLSTERFQAAMLIGFGASALLLAMLGIYGVISYSLASRKQEIGLRIAIGATRAKIYALALDESGLAVITGLAAGLLVSMASGRLVQNLLYGVSAFDFSAALIVALLFLSAACLAAFLPARRAASIDPIEALRSE